MEGDGLLADITFNIWKEKGTITLNGQQFDVQKDGMLSRKWTLVLGGREIASATKVSLFKRTFDITMGLDEWQLRAESALGRRFLIIRSNEIIGRISPVHGFTRRATVEMTASAYDSQLVAFSFWLVILIWRRAASSS